MSGFGCRLGIGGQQQSEQADSRGLVVAVVQAYWPVVAELPAGGGSGYSSSLSRRRNDAG